MQRFALAILVASVAVLVASAAVPALEPCEGSSCAEISVGSDSGAPGEVVTVSVGFTQGPDDGQAGQGNDEVAALAFTLGIPGTGAGAPLQLECVDSNGDGTENALAANAVEAGPAIGGELAVVVENAECTNRTRCLCPDTDAGQTRDDFINIVVYGPKDIPEEGPVTIPVLPDGELLSINMTVARGTPEGTIPLHVFAETDDQGGTPKPQFSAFLSIGDQAAIDQTADRDADLSKVRFSDGEITVEPGETACVGDCDGNGQVAINELILGVNISLDRTGVDACTAMDANGDGKVAINELIQAVNNSLGGCSQ